MRGQEGGRDTAWEQKAQVKGQENRSSHLEACPGPGIVFGSRCTHSILEVSEYSQQPCEVNILMLALLTDEETETELSRCSNVPKVT